MHFFSSWRFINVLAFHSHHRSYPVKQSDIMRNFCSQKIDLDNSIYSNVIISQPEVFQRKKEKFMKDGVEKLQCIADWDYTLTKFKLDGRRCSSCHKTIEDCDLLPEAYHARAQSLQEYYYAKEVDPTIALPEKIKLMEDWVNLAHEALINYGFKKELLPLAVKHSSLKMRDMIQELIDLTEEHKIPFLIFSAGIADVIEEVLSQFYHKALPQTTHIVSNKMVFDMEGKLVSFTEPVFHGLNKRVSSVINTAAYFHQTDYEERMNVLLLGDNIGDLHMADGLPEGHEFIKIGFLNDRVEERLEEYKKNFDIILLDDGDLSPVIDILLDIVNGRSPEKLIR